MIKELICCLLDLAHWVVQIKRKMKLLEPLPFLKRPIDRSLEVCVFKPEQALNKHAMSFILPYLVHNYLKMCQGHDSYTSVRRFVVRLAPHIFVRVKPDKFGEPSAQETFKRALRSWFVQYCRLHTAVYSIKDAFKPLFENLEFKMQLNFIMNSKVALYEVQLEAEENLSHHFWI